MLYLDTSLLVAALSNEISTKPAQAVLWGEGVDDLAIIHWVLTEFSSAISVKIRTGEITLDKRAEIMATFSKLVAESLTVFVVKAAHFRTAAQFADRHELSLRSGDALHLAIAAEHGAQLCTMDRRLSEAGPPLGVQTRLLA